MPVAILLATYNGEKYLADQLDSLFAQTYSDFLLYAHDDGSTDNTVSILNEYAKKYPEKMIILSYAGTGGARNNFFSLMKQVKAEYYMFCDQDDFWLPDKIGTTLKTLKKVEERMPGRPVLVFTDLVVVDKNLQKQADSFMDLWKIIPEEYSMNKLMRSNIAPGCTIMINRTCRDLAVSINNIENFEMHDHLVMLIAKLCGEAKYLNQKTILYRQHGNNTLGAFKRSNKEWLMEKAKNIISGTQIKSSYKTIENQKKVISELCLLPDVLPRYREMMNDLKTLPDSNKIVRMRIYYKHSLLRRDWKDRWKIILV